MPFSLHVLAEVQGVPHHLELTFNDCPAVHEVVEAAEEVFTILTRSVLCPPPSVRAAAATCSSVAPVLHWARPSTPDDALAYFPVASLEILQEASRVWTPVYGGGQLRYGAYLRCVTPHTDTHHATAGTKEEAETIADPHLCLPPVEATIAWQRHMYDMSIAPLPPLPPTRGALAAARQHTDTTTPRPPTLRRMLPGGVVAPFPVAPSTPATAELPPSAAAVNIGGFSGRVRDIFNAVDVDGSGFLILRGLYEFAQSYGVLLPPNCGVGSLSTTVGRSSAGAAVRRASAHSSAADAPRPSPVHLITVLHQQLQLSGLEDIVRHADVNSDGVISFREWVLYCLQHPLLVDCFYRHLREGSPVEGWQGFAGHAHAVTADAASFPRRSLLTVAAKVGSHSTALSTSHVNVSSHSRGTVETKGHSSSAPMPRARERHAHGPLPCSRANGRCDACQEVWRRQLWSFEPRIAAGGTRDVGRL